VSPDRGRTSPSANFLAIFFEPEVRAWRGVAPLGKVFWGYGVLVSSILIFLYVRALYEDRVAIQQVLLLCSAGYAVWVLVAVWRCADNAQPFWGLLARWLTVAWAANTAMVLVFLQLDLVSRYLAP
jgi:hypothetical protein